MGYAMGGSEQECSPSIEAFGLLTTASDLLREHRVGIQAARGWSSIVCECGCDRAIYTWDLNRVKGPIAWDWPLLPCCITCLPWGRPHCTR